MSKNPRDVLKKLQKQKKQKETVIKPMKNKNPINPNIKSVGIVAKEEEEYRKFFTEILTYDNIDNIMVEMRKFSKEPKAY